MTGPRASGDRSAAVGASFGIIATGDNATFMQSVPAPAPAAVEAPPGTHNLPTPAGGVFVGRDLTLAALDARAGVRRGVTGHVLHGLGGVGKTALALRYAHAHCAEYRLVWWVSAETESLLADGVSGLAARLASVPQSLVDGYSWAIGWLQSHRGWLLVLDNVEDPERLRGLLGAVQGRGRVLATTRRNLAAPVWAQLGLVPLRLDVLDRAASVRLLLGLTGRVGDEDGAALLAAELGDMPLALEQAGAFIAQEGWSFVRYRRELLASPGRTYSAVAEGTEARPVVGRVWSVAVERAVHRAPMAEWVLSVLAWLAPAPLPVSLLVDGGDDADAVTQAVRLLASYSLLTRSAGTVEVHRLVQAATRAHDRDSQQHRLAAARLLVRPVSSEPATNAAARSMWDQLLPHVEALASHTPAGQHSPDLWRVLSAAAAYLLAQGQLDRATALFERVTADRLGVLGADDPDTLVAQHDLAVAYAYGGRLGAAVPLLEEVVVDARRVFGADHPETLAARSSLAYAYRSAGRLDEAIALLEQVVAELCRSRGADDPGTVAERIGLTLDYALAGRLDAAVPLLEEVVVDARRVFGADHPETLAARNNLGFAYQSAGRLDAAIRLFEQVVADARRVLGEDHPGTLNSRHNLALAYESAGRRRKAIRLLEQVAADRLRVLGADHPDTLDTRYSVAVTHGRLGRRRREIPLIEQVAADMQRVLGADHPRTLAARHSLAVAYGCVGRIDEAVALLEQVAADAQQVLGDEHPDTKAYRRDLTAARADARR